MNKFNKNLIANNKTKKLSRNYQNELTSNTLSQTNITNNNRMFKSTNNLDNKNIINIKKNKKINIYDKSPAYFKNKLKLSSNILFKNIDKKNITNTHHKRKSISSNEYNNIINKFKK